MNELIDNPTHRKKLLKQLILQLHEGESPAVVKKRLVEVLQKVPYGDVAEVEQELIEEGLPESEILALCDIHTQVLDGHIDHTGAKIVPAGHPVDTLQKENAALEQIVQQLNQLYKEIEAESSTSKVTDHIQQLKIYFNQLMDVDKHYRRKENLVFPYLEKSGITGPPHVMWGKHDQTRELLKAVRETLQSSTELSLDELKAQIPLIFNPASTSITDMILKEEEILFPMSMDALTETEWYQIYQQTIEIGYCLIDPKSEWIPLNIENPAEISDPGTIQLPSGQFSIIELEAVLNALSVDMTFVDKDNKVKYFSQGKHRIFDRNRAILNRDVSLCHPPASVHVVENILQDFKSGKEDSAPFWLELGGKFIHIEYFALRDKNGDYLGTLEVSQDLTEKRALTGEQRLLSFGREG